MFELADRQVALRRILNFIQGIRSVFYGDLVSPPKRMLQLREHRLNDSLELFQHCGFHSYVYRLAGVFVFVKWRVMFSSSQDDRTFAEALEFFPAWPGGLLYIQFEGENEPQRIQRSGLTP